MDFVTLFGLFIGVLLIGTALVIGGVPVQTVLQPEALLVVFGGTLTALLINFSWHDVRAAVAALNRALRRDNLTPEEVVAYVNDAAIYIRFKGILAIQPMLDQVEIPFLRRGLTLMVDNHPAEHIKALLTTEMEATLRAAMGQARVFEVAGGAAPTMGIIGAIIGLTQIMHLLSNPERLGPVRDLAWKEVRRKATWAGFDVPRILEFDEVHEKFIAGLMRCNSWLAVLMITDLLGTTQRFNVPGTVDAGNWSVRLPANWQSDYKEKVERVAAIIRESGR